MPILRISLVVAAGPRYIATARTAQKTPLPTVREVESRVNEQIKYNNAKSELHFIVGKEKEHLFLEGSQASPAHTSDLQQFFYCWMTSLTARTAQKTLFFVAYEIIVNAH
jgi:hypothetical protein